MRVLKNIVFPIVSLAIASSAWAERVELRIGHPLSPESHYQAASKRMAEIAAQKSDGEIVINVFPQSQLGGEVTMIQSARSGVLDMLITGQAALVNTVKNYRIFDMPYLFGSTEEANKVLAGPVGQEFLDMLPEYGLVGLGFLTVTERNVFSSKPINKKEDLAGLKLRVMQSPGYVEAYRLFGVLPTPMAYTELFLGLQQGVVDGADTSPDQFMMDKFFEVSKYYNLTHVHYLPTLLLMSKSRWDKLTEEQQNIIQDSARQALAENKELYLKSYKESLERMEQVGVSVVKTDIEEMKKVIEDARPAMLADIENGQMYYDKIMDAKTM